MLSLPMVTWSVCRNVAFILQALLSVSSAALVARILFVFDQQNLVRLWLEFECRKPDKGLV